MSWECIAEQFVLMLLIELRARADEIGKEWERLHGAINEVARIHAEKNVVAAFRVLHDMAMAVGQRRLELDLPIAPQVGPPRQRGWHADDRLRQTI